MIKIIFDKIIRADRNKVFDIATDYESFQKTHPKYFASVRVLSTRDNTSIVEEHIKLAGRELVMTTKHVIKPPERHDVFVIGGNAKGSRIIEKYQSVPEGTKVTVEANLKLQGSFRLLGMLGKRKIQSGMESIMDEFAKLAESEK